METDKIEQIKTVIKEELMRDFEDRRLRPYSRHKHLLEHINFKIDKLIKPD